MKPMQVVSDAQEISLCSVGRFHPLKPVDVSIVSTYEELVPGLRRQTSTPSCSAQLGGPRPLIGNMSQRLEIR